MLHAPSKPFAGASSSQRRTAFSGSRVSRGSLQVTNALTRQRKEEVVEVLKGKLDNSVIVFGFRFNKLNVATQQKFRRGLPEKTEMMITKNSLMKVAAEANGNWSTLIDKGCKGENAWVFVHEDDISDAVKHYFSFASELEKEAKAAAPKGSEVKAPAEISCAVMDNKYLSIADLKRCESLPTKKQLYATIARLLKQPATKLATGIKMVPTKLAYGIKALAELDEDKAKLVGDVAKPKEA